jgi:hypothetical protein
MINILLEIIRTIETLLSIEMILIARIIDPERLENYPQCRRRKMCGTYVQTFFTTGF